MDKEAPPARGSLRASEATQGTPEDAASVLAFWFGPGTGARAEWFTKDAAFDDLVRQRFGATIEQAFDDGLDAWGDEPQALLARIVVLDQFTRNAFRDSARAFAGDGRALALARQLVARGDDRRLPPIRRWFAYLPFEHAEDLAAQDESVRLFEGLARENPSMTEALVWARKHRDVILRFGRYPHRNQVLGRASTSEEASFLEQPGSRF